MINMNVVEVGHVHVDLNVAIDPSWFRF